ncbi:hypothetical protein HK104_010646 [Borealophlyctis nickersoniae]|nr:hypothetical protein HK104_010646 [Borealophlyctis nickersoniae]
MQDPNVIAQVVSVVRDAENNAGGGGGQTAVEPVLDAVVSDMAHPFTGSRTADVARVHDLCRLALGVAEMDGMLKKGGSFVCKFLDGEGDKELKDEMRSKFDKVIHEKPEASRKESSEAFLVCIGYKGKQKQS